MLTISRFSTRVAMLVATATLAAGCARTLHRRDGFGVANHTFFDRQAQAATSGTAQGLDSEEAAMIHARYRETLGGKASGKSDARASSVLILQEESNAGSKRKE